MSIADDSGATLTVRSVHSAYETTVLEGRTLVTYCEETTMSGITRIATCNVDCHDDILVSTSTTAYKTQTAYKALCTLDRTVDNEVADG